MNFQQMLQKAGELVVTYVPLVVGALIVLVVGLFFIKHLTKLIRAALNKSKMDPSLKPFIVSLSSTVMKVLLIISVLGMVQIEMTSFVAIIGASSLAIGLAFQGALANLAGGVLLLTLRPFKVGDFIDAAGYQGSVEAIHIFNTQLVTPDNKVISIPNGSLSNTSVVNYNIKPTRRVDLSFGVGYEQDIDKVYSVLNEIYQEHDLIHKEPEPFVKVLEHGDSAVVFVVRVWTETSNYWSVHFDLLESVKKRFDREGISIPYPQMDVHIDK